MSDEKDSLEKPAPTMATLPETSEKKQNNGTPTHKNNGNGKRWPQRNGNTNSNGNNNTTKFQGETEGLKGFVFDVAAGFNADPYSKTAKRIANYVGREFTNGGDLKVCVERLAMIMPNMPSDPPKNASRTEEELWKNDVALYAKKRQLLQTNNAKLYSVVWGQCTDGMKQKVRSHPDFRKTHLSSDGIGLLTIIRSICYNFNGTTNPVVGIYQAMMRFSRTLQHQLDNAQYLEQFKNIVAVTEEGGGMIGMCPGVAASLAVQDGHSDFSALDYDERQQYMAKAQQEFLAVAFIHGADRNRYSELERDLKNQYAKGKDEYPKTLDAAYSLLCEWKQDSRRGPQPSLGAGDNNNNTERVNDHDEHTVTGTDGRNVPHIKCFNCNEKGHYADNCPENHHSGGESADEEEEEEEEEGEEEEEEEEEEGMRQGRTFFMTALEEEILLDDDNDSNWCMVSYGSTKPAADHRSDGTDHEASDTAAKVLAHKEKHGALPDNWLILDSASTIDTFWNRKLLTNIRKTDSTITIHCNAGMMQTNMIGTVPGYGDVWYHPDGIANILSLAKVKKIFRVTYDSSEDNAFYMHRNDGSCRVFRESGSGLHYHDLTSEDMVLTKNVTENKSKWTVRTRKKAEDASKTKRGPNKATFKNYYAPLAESDNGDNFDNDNRDIPDSGGDVDSPSEKTGVEDSTKDSTKKTGVEDLIKDSAENTGVADDALMNELNDPNGGQSMKSVVMSSDNSLGKPKGTMEKGVNSLVKSKQPPDHRATEAIKYQPTGETTCDFFSKSPQKDHIKHMRKQAFEHTSIT